MPVRAWGFKSPLRHQQFVIRGLGESSPGISSQQLIHLKVTQKRAPRRDSCEMSLFEFVLFTPRMYARASLLLVVPTRNHRTEVQNSSLRAVIGGFAPVELCMPKLNANGIPPSTRCGKIKVLTVESQKNSGSDRTNVTPL